MNFLARQCYAADREDCISWQLLKSLRIPHFEVVLVLVLTLAVFSSKLQIKKAESSPLDALDVLQPTTPTRGASKGIPPSPILNFYFFFLCLSSMCVSILSFVIGTSTWSFSLSGFLSGWSWSSKKSCLFDYLQFQAVVWQPVVWFSWLNSIVL